MYVYENMCLVSGSGGDWGVQFIVKHYDKEGSDKGESKDDTCRSSEINSLKQQKCGSVPSACRSSRLS